MWDIAGLQSFLADQTVTDTDAELTALLQHVRALGATETLADDFSVLRIDI
jgi:hypothetical protein